MQYKMLFMCVCKLHTAISYEMCVCNCLEMLPVKLHTIYMSVQHTN